MSLHPLFDQILDPMTKIYVPVRAGGDAFPKHPDGSAGMSLKEYYVGQAIAGLCASTGLYDASHAGVEQLNNAITSQIAERAVEVAAKALKELEKEQ